MPRAYLDHASSTPLRPAALDAMLPYLRDHPGDPGRVHTEGKTTRVAVEVAREQVAALFGARPREVVFTATGTESVNTAVWGGVARGLERQGRERVHVVTTAVEHSAVLDSCHRAPAERDSGRRRPRRPGRRRCAARDAPSRHGPGQRAAREPRGRHRPGRARRGRLPLLGSAGHSSTSTRARPPGTCRSTSRRSASTCAP